MRILMLTSTLPRFAGDLQANFVREQADAWLTARSDAEIDILAPNHPDARIFEEEDRLRISRFRYFLPQRWQGLAYPAILPNLKRQPLLALQIPGFLAAQYAAANRIVKTRRIDCIYAHWVVPQGLVARRLSRKLGVPYVLQNHSSDLAVLAKLGSFGQSVAASLLTDCDRFFCVNSQQLDYARGLVASEYRAGFDRKALSLPMGFVSDDWDQPAGSADDWTWDIATMGRLSKKKGLDHLINAAEILARKGIRPRIAIAGDGEERTALEALVDKSDITFTGFLTGADKAQFLASAHCHVFPAKASGGDREGMPVAMLEALARGRPVLASADTNIEMLPEWDRLEPCVTFVKDPADANSLAAALERLLDTPSDGGQETQDVISRYRWENLIEEYLEPLERALDNRC